MKTTFILSLTVVFNVACATQEQQMPPADTATLQTFNARCGACHSLPHPARHTAQEWPHILGLMERRMRERRHTPLAADERKRILGYLTEHAR